MGNSCSQECEEVKQKLKDAEIRVDEVNAQLESNVEKARDMQEALESKYREMQGAHGARIDDLKAQIAESREAKKEVDADVRRLQANLVEIQREHAQIMLQSNQIFAKTIKDKDDAMKEMITNMFKEFKDLIKELNAKNERQFDKMMTQMDRQDKRIGDILDRMDKRIEKLEERQFGITSAEERSKREVDEEDFEADHALGSDLYRMVEERRAEINARSVSSTARFIKIAPIVNAAIAALDAASRYSQAPVIAHSA